MIITWRVLARSKESASMEAFWLVEVYLGLGCLEANGEVGSWCAESSGIATC